MFRNIFFRVLLVFVFLASYSHAQKDPLNSPMWNDVIKMFFKNETYIIDSNIIIKVPSFADNALQVPVYVDASYYKNAQRLLLFADLNAIIPLVDMQLLGLLPIISLNMKIAQGTPLRAAIKDKNGLWHINSVEIKSFGGGCAVASEASLFENAQNLFGKHKIKTFNINNRKRIKLSIYHPMDTGLFVGNPEFFINKITIKSDNKIKAQIITYASVSENPRLIFEDKKSNSIYEIILEDTDGNIFKTSTKDKK
ncbi:MAG: thiosulfate oxidation carrier complex protein SoxZ [Campylobacteraceae bacterium]|nr:thiosulfate oxidation carrier complex protein SoxZ [Campylobacteraceae bacterium]